MRFIVIYFWITKIITINIFVIVIEKVAKFLGEILCFLIALTLCLRGILPLLTIGTFFLLRTLYLKPIIGQSIWNKVDFL